MIFKTLDKRTRMITLILALVVLIGIIATLFAAFGNRGFKYGDAIDIGDYRYIYLGCRNFKEYKLGAVKMHVHSIRTYPVCETEQDLLEVLSPDIFNCSWDEAKAKGCTVEQMYHRFLINEDAFEAQKSSFIKGWRVLALDTARETYEDIPEKLRGIPVVSMRGTFEQCREMTTAPAIPSGVIDMTDTFQFCYALRTYAGSTERTGDFTGYVIPNGVISMDGAFQLCRLMRSAPTIPDGVTNLKNAFNGCASLIAAPVIPSNVSNMVNAFSGCTSLTGTISINTNNIISSDNNDDGSCRGCFYRVDMTDITLEGEASEDMLNLIGATGEKWEPISSEEPN